MKINFTLFLIIFTNFLWAQNEFITVWKPNNFAVSVNNSYSSNTQIYFPGVGNGYKIYWEEVGNPNHNGTLTNITTTQSSPLIIDFGNGLSADSQYLVKVDRTNGTFSNFELSRGDFYKILDVKQWGNIEWTTMKSAFKSGEYLEVTATDIPRLTNVTDFSEMFYDCDILMANSTFSTWNISNATDLTSMFAFAKNFNQNIGNWDTSKVTNLKSMFEYAYKFNQDLSNWNTANVTDFSYLFSRAENFNQNIGNWNTTNATTMHSMFNGAKKFNQNIGSWNTANVFDFSNMFADAENFNQNIGGWNIANATDMSGMLSAPTFNQDIGNWNTSKVLNMNSMFAGAFMFNKNIGNWDTSKVIDMASMFLGTHNFNQNIGNWNTSSVQNMSWMFYSAYAFNQNIGNWNVQNVTDMSWMFFMTNLFNQDIGNWNISNVIDMSAMFSGTKAFNQNIGNWNTSNVTKMEQLFSNAEKFDQSLENWSLTNVENIKSMFSRSKISCQNYDKTLVGWANNASTPHNLQFKDNIDVVYSSQEAVNARNYLMNTKGWIITGDIYNPNCALSTNDYESKNIQVYPNPIIDFVNIKSKDNAEFDYTITDFSGRLLLKGKSNHQKINLQTLPKGNYLLELMDKSGVKIVKSIIKK